MIRTGTGRSAFSRSAPGLSRRAPGLLVAVAIIVGVWAAPSVPVAADSTGSSSSRVVGRGDIITTIIGMATRKSGRSGATAQPRCVNHRFTDAEIEFLVALIGQRHDSDEARSLVEIFQRHLLAGAPDDPSAQEFDVVARICDGRVTDVRAVPIAVMGDLTTALARSMITRIPEPVIVQTPPFWVPVPVNQPVFTSIPSENWQPIDAQLTVRGITAQVRAEPVTIRTYTGEREADFGVCEGPGHPFEAVLQSSPRAQAVMPGRCIMTYRFANRDDDSTLDRWLGAVTVLWRAEWRTGDGQWRSLGIIPRTRLVQRRAVEVTTSLTSERA